MVDNTQSEKSKPKESHDSDRQQLATVYAKSLLAATAKAGNTVQVLEQLESFVSDVLGRLPKLEDALRSLRLSSEAKSALIDKATPGAEKELNRFLKVVCQHGRADCLREISTAARRMHNEASGRGEAIAVTATPASEQMRNEIRDNVARMLGKDVEIDYQVDPAIIGGLIIQVGDTVYDGSLANQLTRARKKVVESASQEIRKSLQRFSSSDE